MVGVCVVGVCGKAVCMAGGMHCRGVHSRGAYMDGRRDGHCSRQYASYRVAFFFREHSSAVQHSPVVTREIVCSSLVTHSI